MTKYHFLQRIPWIRSVFGATALFLIASLGVFGQDFSEALRPQTVEDFMRTDDRVRVIAHRGFSGQAPENTVAAIHHAITVGADMAEIDVTLTADNRVVCLHDEKVNRTTNGYGRISALTLVEVQKLDAGFWFSPEFTGERIPTLDAVLEAAKNRILLNIEIKSETVERGIAALVVDAVKAHSMTDEVLISSFSPEALVQVHDLEPDLHTSSLFNRKLHRKIDPGTIVEEARSSSLNINRRFLNGKIRQRCIELEIPIGVYTANSRRQMEKLIDMGVHSIFTDHPDLLLEVLDSRAD